MTLDIIVPRYKEPWELCRYLFTTISTQEAIDFNNIKVIMVNDGDQNVLEKTCFEGFPYRIEYYVKPHGGVSAARNAGLMASKADYVMFCDADDGFLSNFGIYVIMAAANEGADYINSSFIEETLDKDGNMILVPHKGDYTFIHGKAYKRSFLMDNDIQFDPEMTIHEDGYFNAVAYAVASKTGIVKNIESPFYIWRWNPKSVVRNDRSDFVLKTYGHLIQTHIGMAEQYKARGYDKELRLSVGMTVLNSYYDFQKTTYTQPKNRQLKEKAERAFKKYWMAYKKIFNDMTYQEIGELAVAARANAVKNGMMIEQMDLKSWLKHIEREVH